MSDVCKSFAVSSSPAVERYHQSKELGKLRIAVTQSLGPKNAGT